jgi:hypothetical protein
MKQAGTSDFGTWGRYTELPLEEMTSDQNGNAAEDVATALRDAVVRSFLQPATHKIPMVSAPDVGRCATPLMQRSWQSKESGSCSLRISTLRKASVERFVETCSDRLDRAIGWQF